MFARQLDKHSGLRLATATLIIVVVRADAYFVDLEGIQNTVSHETERFAGQETPHELRLIRYHEQLKTCLP